MGMIMMLGAILVWGIWIVLPMFPIVFFVLLNPVKKRLSQLMELRMHVLLTFSKSIDVWPNNLVVTTAMAVKRALTNFTPNGCYAESVSIVLSAVPVATCTNVLLALTDIPIRWPVVRFHTWLTVWLVMMGVRFVRYRRMCVRVVRKGICWMRGSVFRTRGLD